MDTISPVPTRPLYMWKPLSKPQAPSLFRQLFLGNIQEIGSSLSRLLDFHCRLLEDYGGLSLARATKLQVCASSHPVSLSICPSASAPRPISDPYHLQIVQLRRRSSTVRTLRRRGITTLWRCTVASLKTIKNI